MTIPSRATTAGTYFVTSATYNRRRLFQVPSNAEVFIDTLQHYRRAGHYKLRAFVVMPDHIHLLITPGETTSLERVIGLIKGGFSHRVGSKFPVWQRGFTHRRVVDLDEFVTKKRYIHQNPVRAGMVQSAEMYAYSSACVARD
jgi:putative transposase